MAGRTEIYRRVDGKFAFRVIAANGQIVATDGGQGYSSRADARSTAEKLVRGGYDGPVEDVDRLEGSVASGAARRAG